MELYRDRIIGAISGLGRIRFRGTLRWLARERGADDIHEPLNGRHWLERQLQKQCIDYVQDLFADDSFSP